MRMTTRRRILQGAAAAGVAGALPLGFRGALAADVERITVTSFGGIWERAVKECFVPDFKARTGVDADVLIGGPPQWINQVEANRDNPPIHAMVATVDSAFVAGRAGLVDLPTPEKLSNLPDVPKRFVDIVGGFGVCFDYGAAGIAYNKEVVTDPPKSLEELVDRTAKGDFVCALPNIAYSSTPIMLIWSLADAFGGSVDNVDPAFAAIQKMRKNVRFWSGVTDFLNLMDSGETDLGLYWDGRTWAHHDAGGTYIDFLNPTEGAALSPVAVMKVKNAPDIAWEYVNSMLAPVPQAKFSEILNYGVTNSKVQYSDKLAKRITPWEQTRIPPYLDVGARLGEWTERWNKEVGA